MVLTPDGEEFMDYARDILNRIGKLEQSYRGGSHKKRNFSVSVPRACYISAAMAEFSKNIGGAGCLTHGEKNKAEVDKYGQEALEKTISDAVSVLK